MAQARRRRRSSRCRPSPKASSGVNPKSQTLNPKPYTQNPNPQTPIPELETRTIKSQTPNPNPKPKIQNPAPPSPLAEDLKHRPLDLSLSHCKSHQLLSRCKSHHLISPKVMTTFRPQAGSSSGQTRTARISPASRAQVHTHLTECFQ